MTVTHQQRAGGGVPSAGQASYVYAIVPAATELVPDLAGLDDQPVGLIRHGSVGAIVGSVPSGRPVGRRNDLIAHMRVVDVMATQGPTVPVRFGSVLTDAAEVESDLLAPNTSYFSDVLAYVAGRRQFIVRGRYDEETVLAEIVSERRDIAELRDRTRELPDDVGLAEKVHLGELVSHALDAKRADDARAVLERLRPHAVDWNTRASADVDDLIHVSLLVDDHDRDTFEEAAEAAATALAGRARLRLLGPSAAYDFVPDV